MVACGQEWQGLTEKVNQGTFESDGDVPYLNTVVKTIEHIFVHSCQNYRTVYLKQVCFIVSKLYLNKVDFKKEETEYEQRRRETFFSLKCLSFFLCPRGFQGPTFINSVKILPKI